MLAQSLVTESERALIVPQLIKAILLAEYGDLVRLSKKPAKQSVLEEIATRKKIQWARKQHGKDTWLKKGAWMVAYQQ